MKPSFEKAVLVASALFVVFLIARYDVCFQDGEVMKFDLAAVANGPGFSFRDLTTVFKVTNTEDDTRARFVTYFSFFIALKTRLALWNVLPPHPSFSPVWLLTLIVGPWLLFKFLETEIGDRSTAMAGVAAYLVSTGCLSGVTMLFRPAKPLTNVLIIAVFYLSAQLRRRWSMTANATLAALLALAPFVDESAVFAYAIPIVWCRTLPKATYVIPAAFAALVLFAIIPAFPGLIGADAPRLGLGGYLFRTAASAFSNDGWRFDLQHIIWNGINLVIPQTLPWSMARTVTPVVDSTSLPVPALMAVGTILLLASWAAYRIHAYWDLYRRLALLAGGFMMFQTLVFVFHPQQLSATGFHYGAIFSVLFSSLAAVTYATIRHAPRVRWMARPLLVWILTISALNFLAINSMWMLHSNTKTLDDIEVMPWYHSIGDWRRFDALRAGPHPAPPHAPEGQYTHSPDDERRTAGEHFSDAMGLWRNWREGKSDFVGDRPPTHRQLWLINELALRPKRSSSSSGLPLRGMSRTASR